ncbi:MAG: lysophospholipid acyltransferase family protein [Gammaproteobacteria bacterium]|nr:lysophospholipid acyltransferase family protein [Gammaproteobacteria bacterium]
MSSFRKFYRSVLLTLLIIIGVILTILFLRNTLPTRGISSSTIITTWSGLVAGLFGVKIKSYGTPLTEKTLFIANHISWLDIFVLGHLVPMHFLAKHEVKTMPVFGWLATRAGTLYIERGNNNSAKGVNDEIVNTLKQGHNSLIFAEGTTTDGNVSKFHSRMMQSAIDAQAMVQPVAIFYPVKDPETEKKAINPAILYLDNTSIAKSFDLISRTSSIDVEVHFLKPISSTGQTRNEIAQHAFDEVVAAINSIKGQRTR